MEFLSNHWSDILFFLTSVCTACTVITALTPTNSDDMVLDAILKVLNILAGNVAKNRNADDV